MITGLMGGGGRKRAWSHNASGQQHRELTPAGAGVWTLVLLICRIVIVKIPDISNSFGQGQNKELVTMIAESPPHQ